MKRTDVTIEYAVERGYELSKLIKNDFYKRIHRQRNVKHPLENNESLLRTPCTFSLTFYEKIQNNGGRL